MENLLTIEETALRLRVNPETVRRQLRDGRLRGIKRGNWRVPESALMEQSPGTRSQSSAAELAAQYTDSLQSRDGNRRNAAIIALMSATPEVRAIVEFAAEKAAAEYYATDLGQAELADWRALDGEPFNDDAGEESATP